ncbi:DinB family protein [Planomicrobium sp. Y74]|uniref:DinB family protein n=1 Tax=Planomicrobium sp. Y74 TaxID=2478977 RepID=UPI000EF458BD|nr:DinB family protein [Planomicrobium sp. Y74]RLQ92187.1 DinB family protein [Planomicrobium sp. Y74]
MFKEENEIIRQRIFKAVEELSDEKLNKKPAEGKWSPMQILDHLHLMENVIARNISKELDRGNSKKAMKKPIQLTVSRTIKVDAPSYTEPSEDFITLVEMTEKLASSRANLNAVYDNAPKELLKTKSMPHPVFGKVPLFQWFPFIGLHEKRHLKQLENTLSEINKQ